MTMREMRPQSRLTLVHREPGQEQHEAVRGEPAGGGSGAGRGHGDPGGGTASSLTALMITKELGGTFLPKRYDNQW